MAEPGDAAGPGSSGWSGSRTVVDRVLGLAPDHVLITGDLTTTALPGEFARRPRGARRPPDRPGAGHGRSRATTTATRPARCVTRQFEAAFGDFAAGRAVPLAPPIDDETAILGLDATRSHLSATGHASRRAARRGRRPCWPTRRAARAG